MNLARVNLARVNLARVNLARAGERDPAKRRADLLARMKQRRNEALVAGDEAAAAFWSDYIRDLQDS